MSRNLVPTSQAEACRSVIHSFLNWPRWNISCRRAERLRSVIRWYLWENELVYTTRQKVLLIDWMANIAKGRRLVTFSSSIVISLGRSCRHVPLSSIQDKLFGHFCRIIIVEKPKTWIFPSGQILARMLGWHDYKFIFPANWARGFCSVLLPGLFP